MDKKMAKNGTWARIRHTAVTNNVVGFGAKAISAFTLGLLTQSPELGIVGATSAELLFNWLSDETSYQLTQVVGSTLRPKMISEINHDLQAAWRDAFTDAVLDVGNVALSVERKHVGHSISEEITFPLPSTDESKIIRALYERADDLFPNEVKEGAYRSAALYLDTAAPMELSNHFWFYVRDWLGEHVPDHRLSERLEAHLETHLFGHTLAHVREHLKERTPAWRAFNMMVLQSVLAGNDANAAQLTVIQKQLDILTNNRQSDVLASNEPFLAEMADGIGEIGVLVQRLDGRFDELLVQVSAEHQLLLTGIDAIQKQGGRIEQKLDDIHKDVLHVTVQQIQALEDVSPTPGEPPYKGLVAFTQADAGLFFGRDALTEKVVDRIKRERMTVVTGASGSGKSSLIQAGVLPRLEAEGWRPIICTPTDNPLAAVARALYRDDPAARKALMAEMVRRPTALAEAAALVAENAPAGRCVVVIDQFEELFTLAKTEETNGATIRNLLHLAEGDGETRLVMTLRSDFYDACALYEEDGLFTAVSDTLLPVTAMTEGELRQAIETPLQRRGWQIQDGLVAEIIEDVGDEPGRLPLLSHALRETWEQRRGTVLTLSGYRKVGGIKRAITETADKILNSFDGTEQAIARAVFTALTELGDVARNQPDTRGRGCLYRIRPRRSKRCWIRSLPGGC